MPRASGTVSRSKRAEHAASLLRHIPAIDQALADPRIQQLCAQFPRDSVVDALRRHTQLLRRRLERGELSEAEFEESLADMPFQVEKSLEARFSPSLRRVINATGVVLHTNLGRAPLAAAAIARLQDVATGYSNLEFNLEMNERGKRDVHAEHFLKSLLGCEAALVVNNCAAAVLLTLNCLAESGEVIVSRGELVEIGGSFRIPDIMRKSGALLREVGTTNRTRLSDYSRAINKNTRLILRVHRSNFRMIGFSEQPTLEELATLAHKKHLPLLKDLGSGCLVDLVPQGIRDEPTVQSCLKAGADVVTFSGDKLLGGAQAGIIVGRKKYVNRLRENPLYRALRVDKLTLAALEATMLAYLRKEEKELIPALRIIFALASEVRTRAETLIQKVRQAISGDTRLELSILEGQSVIGGGSTPGEAIPTFLISVRAATRSAAAVEKHFRNQRVPILVRVERNQVLIDLRTVFPEEEEKVIDALVGLAAPSQ